MKKYALLCLAIVALLGLAPEAEAQVNPGYHPGIPVQHGPVANGTVRHDYNGYQGVNPRHYSRVPMRYGTGPVRATGPIVIVHRPYVYPAMPCGNAYIARRPFGGGFVVGGAVVHPMGQPRGFVSVGVSGPSYAVGGTVVIR